MDKDESVLNLLIEKDKFKKLYQENQKVLQWIYSRLYSIGAPLNDNVLAFNGKQLKFLFGIANEIKTVL